MRGVKKSLLSYGRCAFHLEGLCYHILDMIIDCSCLFSVFSMVHDCFVEVSVTEMADD